MRVLSIALSTSFILLVGCGQKGPLYLPQDQSNAAAVADQPSQAAVEQEKKAKTPDHSSNQ